MGSEFLEEHFEDGEESLGVGGGGPGLRIQIADWGVGDVSKRLAF